MNLRDIPFGTTDWPAIDGVVERGERGSAVSRTRQFGDVRARTVEYSADYLMDHWCRKGHVLICMHGELRARLRDGRLFTLHPGVSLQVGDDASEHRIETVTGATVFILD